MRCEDCDVRLKVTHSYQAGRMAKTATAQCPKCRKKYTAITILVSGDTGASAWAKKLKSTCIAFKNRVLSTKKRNLKDICEDLGFPVEPLEQTQQEIDALTGKRITDD